MMNVFIHDSFAKIDLGQRLVSAVGDYLSNPLLLASTVEPALATLALKAN